MIVSCGVRASILLVAWRAGFRTEFDNRELSAGVTNGDKSKRLAGRRQDQSLPNALQTMRLQHARDAFKNFVPFVPMHVTIRPARRVPRAKYTRTKRRLSSAI